jgi:Ca-activated chloride channel family protein
MLPALEMALDTRSEPIGESAINYLRQVVFITDGAVGNEPQLFRYIHENLGDRRLFTVGIGSAPNSYFMHKAAKFGRGTYTFIGDLNEVEERMGQLFAKMAQPTLTNLEVEFEGTRGGSFEMLPGQLPDLYQGEPVVVSLKMSATPTRAVLKGILGGRPWKTSILLKNGANQAGIGVLFGRRKVESWMNRRVTGTDEEQVSQAIVELGFDYHLVTRYTSLVAVDVTPIREVNDPDSQRPPGQPSLILARTATSSIGQILLGLMLLIVFLILFRPGSGRSRQLVTSNT